MSRFYIIQDIKHVCIGKEGPIKNLNDHRPLLFFPDELEEFKKHLVEALKRKEYTCVIDRKIGLLRIDKNDNRWEFTGNRGTYRATTSEVKELLTNLIMPSIKIYRIAKNRSGIVCSAPHGGFDLYSDQIARFVARKLGLGCLVATHFRYPPEFGQPEIIPLYINVNRPTEGQYKNNRLMKEIVTSRAGKVYFQYQSGLIKASGQKEIPLKLLIEIHAHNRSHNFEVATTGIVASEAALIKKAGKDFFLSDSEHWNELKFLVEPVDDIYWKASMAKTFGAFRKEMVMKGLHIEFPYVYLENNPLKVIKQRTAEWIKDVLKILTEE